MGDASRRVPFLARIAPEHVTALSCVSRLALRVSPSGGGMARSGPPAYQLEQNANLVRNLAWALRLSSRYCKSRRMASLLRAIARRCLSGPASGPPARLDDPGRVPSFALAHSPRRLSSPNRVREACSCPRISNSSSSPIPLFAIGRVLLDTPPHPLPRFLLPTHAASRANHSPICPGRRRQTTRAAREAGS